MNSRNSSSAQQEAVLKLNTAIARATHMTSGRIGRDWCSGRPFVAAGKGSEWNALLDCIDAMRAARRALERG